MENDLKDEDSCAEKQNSYHYYEMRCSLERPVERECLCYPEPNTSPTRGSLETEDDLVIEHSPLLNDIDYPSSSVILHCNGSNAAECETNALSSILPLESYPVCQNTERESISHRNGNAHLKVCGHSALPKCSSYGNQGKGCVVLFDSDVESIEITENLEHIGNLRTKCSCNSKPGKLWHFSRYKHRSVDDSQSSFLSSTKSLNRTNSLNYTSNESLPLQWGLVSSSERNCNNDGCLSQSHPDNSAAFQSTSQRPSSVLDASNTSHNTNNNSCLDDNTWFNLTASASNTMCESLDESNSNSSQSDSPEPNVHPLTIRDIHQLENLTSQTCKDSDKFMFGSSVTQISVSSNNSEVNTPFCKICHMVGNEDNPLISPCRCSGTVQFIHSGCLMRWLEICSRKSRKPPACELCQYQYLWHKKFKVRHLQFPHCSRRDKVLHLLFFVFVLIMIGCATITIMCFRNDKGTKIDPNQIEFTQSEVVTLISGVLFFLAFFMAMYVEMKAQNTIYKLLSKFIYLNQQWYIDEYDQKQSEAVAM